MKIFRRFRIKAISSQNVVKYIKYAVGEVILVVLGILIALQVNNWNEKRKNRDKEQLVYTSLIQVLDQDLDHVNLKINYLNSVKKSLELFILNDADTILATYPIDSISHFVRRAGGASSSFMPNKAYYNKLLNTNQIDLITSDDLKANIIKLYEHYYVRYNDLDISIEKQNAFGFHKHYYSLIIDTEIRNGMITVDHKTFKDHFNVLKKECQEIYLLARTVYGAMLDCK